MIAFGTAPCLSKNLINLKAALINPFGTILKVLVKEGDEEKESYRCKYCEEKYINPNRRVK